MQFAVLIVSRMGYHVISTDSGKVSDRGPCTVQPGSNGQLAEVTPM